MQPAHGVPVFSAWPRVPCLTKCVWSGKPSSPLGHGYPGVNESCSQPAFLERRARAWVLIYLNGFIPIQTVHLLPHLLLPTVVQRFHVVSNSHLVKKSTTNMFIFSLHTVFMTFLKKNYFKGISNSGIFARFYYSVFILFHSLVTKSVRIYFYPKMRVNLWDNLTSVYFRHGDHGRAGGWLSLFLWCSSLHVRSFEWHPWAVWLLVLGCRLTLCTLDHA